MWGMTHHIEPYAHAPEKISIHIPHVGDDTKPNENQTATEPFQSTSPMWGMTEMAMRPGREPRYFNPHPPCGG